MSDDWLTKEDREQIKRGAARGSVYRYVALLLRHAEEADRRIEWLRGLVDRHSDVHNLPLTDKEIAHGEELARKIDEEDDAS